MPSCRWTDSLIPSNAFSPEDMATEEPCDIACRFCDGLLAIHDYPQGFPRPGKKGIWWISAIQLSSEHNANNEDVRFELKDLHPDDPQIVVFKHGVWRVKGIILVVSHSLQHLYSTVIEESDSMLMER
ncbi:unnamed protein product [Brassica napus]|uniref:Uncharacterized protein n=2 Tax=Brassica TaxID=3705 RepID=A0A3P6A7M7_BRAOL|nr:unnamed protein product [Brassica napus]VDC85599.1 unnamed protein product [Brassica oleracea]